MTVDVPNAFDSKFYRNKKQRFDCKTDVLDQVLL